jgi:fumarate reductase flavoprotein subunit
MMGGVEFDIDASTAVHGLFAAGEDCGGVHGANRLGGNGVANSTVFGGIAGDSMADFVAREGRLRDPDLLALDQGVARAERPFAAGSGDLFGLRDRLAHTMWDEVGVLRDAAGLRRGLARIADYRAELAAIGIADGDRGFNPTWHDWLNLESLLDVSEVIARAALAREDSRGAHFREDFPETGVLATSTYTRIWREGDVVVLDTTPVSFEIVQPGESLIEGDAGAPPATAKAGSAA